MLFNLIFAFLIPWAIGIFLLIKHPKIVALITPITAVVSFIFNLIGMSLNWFYLLPIYRVATLSAAITDLGIYPILNCYLIYIRRKYNLNPYFLIIFFGAFTTMLEFIGVLTGKVIYLNGWNIGYTFLSYLIAYSIVYSYYKLLVKLNINF